ncbi:MAG TPA: type II toxin-antitoxin system VapC family toxin [Pyrinomonadaceae bacterium]|jgi:predicted nucleic acid-binding protein
MTTTGAIVVVDTDVVSFIFKGDTRGSLYRPHLDGRLAIIAAQTRAELELWTLLRKWGERRRTAMRTYLKNFVFAEADETICLRWAEVQENAQRRGRPISCADGWIAATALAYAVPLVTHNPDDFKNVSGLTILTEK